jgi:hypothetical protein
MIDDRKIIYRCFFAFNFSEDILNIAFQHTLASAIERKIALMGNACSKPPITIRLQSLHVDDIRGAMGEYLPTTRATSSLLSLVPGGCTSFGLSLAFCFVLCVMVLAIGGYWFFCIHQHNTLAKDLLYKYSLRGESPSREDPHKRER